MFHRRTALLVLAPLIALAVTVSLWIWRPKVAAPPEPSPHRTGIAYAAAGAASTRLQPGPGENRLAFEASPYLQLHAHNPVDWYPWGEAAFERARVEGKPIFVSIGYSTCYWCHVMEREVFSNPEIAALMNADFVSVKVDREERPDLDDIYMQATHLLTGSGGWPNSVFLTPDGRPFFAGTYFPPEDRPGRPGFPGVLAGIHEAWSNRREEIEGTADRVTERIGEMAVPNTRKGGAAPQIQESLQHALRSLSESYEPQHGGFSRAVKFPRPPTLDLLAASLEDESNPARLELLTHTLDEMALGGIYDQLAGGFHRYSTEPTWSIPHFEKMLYDNAQLIDIYAQAYTLTRQPLYRRVVEETIRYLDREMSLPEGGFASAQDAEVNGEEGASYLWSRDQIESVLGAERAKAFLGVYELAPMHKDPTVGVLRVRLPIGSASGGEGVRAGAERLAQFDADRSELLEAREKRIQPLRDDKALVAWNALAIRGLVQAARSLDQPAYLERASLAARFLLARLRTADGALRRSYIAGQAREEGVLDDHAFLIDALVALYGATGDSIWLSEAKTLADSMLARFEDPNGGGLFLTPAGLRLLVRLKPFHEGDMPSGNAVALRGLRELARITGDARYTAAASGIVASAAPLLREAPSSLPTMLAALSRSAIDGGTPAQASATAERDGGDEAVPPRAAFRFPRSEDHVRATVTPGASPEDLVVRLSIDSGWHVQANPASLPFLVPTQIEAGSTSSWAEVRYPEGRELRSEFARESIRVYDGDVEIPVRLLAGAQPPAPVAIRFQACDEKLCLPPSRTELPLGRRP